MKECLTDPQEVIHELGDELGDEFRAGAWPRFVHTSLFDREWAALGLADDALRSLQETIRVAPFAPPVIRGTGGLRKVRLSEPGSGRGKSGAYRVGFAIFPAHGTILLVTVWGKGEKSNLSKADQAAIAELLRDIERLLAKGEI